MDDIKIPADDVGCKPTIEGQPWPGDFYMIWRDGARRPPKVIHGDEVAAAREANRLASLAPGKRFIVLRSVACVEVAA